MPDGEGWDRIEYAYDAAGRRIEKKVDGTTQVKYVYDGDHIIAEYNNAGTLLRKYVHGPCVDEPICMIEASGTYAGTHYYHYDALGSVVAMTNSAGNVVQLYEYSVYGQVAASDASHPNRFMFTGREFDKDTGLYYYRARYYNPEIGRFLQTDPIGYGDGMNWYAYCGNRPVVCKDPTGLWTVFVEEWEDVPNPLLEQRLRECEKRVRQVCEVVIAQIDEMICNMGCNQDHEAHECPVISHLEGLRSLMEQIIAGIDSSDPLAIRFRPLPEVVWAGIAEAGWYPMFGDVSVGPPTEHPTMFFNTVHWNGLEPDSAWDSVFLHEISHHYGLDHLGLNEPIRDFLSADSIEQLATTQLWGTSAWAYLRWKYECVEKRVCTCGPTTRDINCPKHGRGRR
jgi:RHS repeat-associated protein